MDNFIVTFIMFLVLTFVSRTIAEKAAKKLEQGKKAELIDLFSKDRTYSFAILIVVIVVFLASIRFTAINRTLIYGLYMLTVLAVILIRSYRAYNKLQQNSFPREYIKSYLLSSCLSLLGLFIFLFSLSISSI